MNIFYLDEDVDLCAQYHCDKHVVKMCLETAQLLCTVVNLSGRVSPYRTTHTNHPCSLWARESEDNYEWLRNFGLTLTSEYTYRYDKNHKCREIIASLPKLNLPRIGITKRPQAMPSKYQQLDPVKAYRAYYKGEKQDILKWTKRSTPDWMLV